MKRLLSITLVLLALTSWAGDDTYYVLFIKGAVKNLTSGKTLNVNDPVKSTDKLQFASNKDVLSVISAAKGRFTIKPKPDARPSELTYTVMNTLVPGTARLSTRDGELLNILDAQKYFGKESFAIFGTLKKRVSDKSFPMNEKKFFFVRYTYKAQVINKKLPFNGDTVLISRNDVLKVDGKPILREEAEGMILYYQGDERMRITEVNFIFPDEKEVKEQLKVLDSSLKQMGKTEEETNKEVVDFLDEAYGFFDIQNLKDWLKSSR